MQLTDPLVSGQGVGVVTSCVYQAVGDPTTRAILIVRQLDGAETAGTFFEQTRQEAIEQLGVTPEEVSGLGDGAYWIGDLYNQLTVRQGSVHLLFSVDGQTVPNEAVKQLVKQALARLP